MKDAVPAPFFPSRSGGDREEGREGKNDARRSKTGRRSVCRAPRWRQARTVTSRKDTRVYLRLWTLSQHWGGSREVRQRKLGSGLSKFKLGSVLSVPCWIVDPQTAREVGREVGEDNLMTSLFYIVTDLLEPGLIRMWKGQKEERGKKSDKTGKTRKKQKHDYNTHNKTKRIKTEGKRITNDKPPRKWRK